MSTTPTAPQHDPPDDLRTVRVLRAPLLLWERANQHTAELLREFALLTLGLEHGGHPVPARLLEVVGELERRYAGVGERPEAQRLAALAAGQRSLDLVYHVPPDVAEACRTLDELFAEADDYCARGDQLITLAAAPDQQEFRRWYLGEFVRQVGGEPPIPWPGPLD